MAAATLLALPSAHAADELLLVQVQINGETVLANQLVRRDVNEAAAFWLPQSAADRLRLRIANAPQRRIDSDAWAQVCAAPPYRCRFDDTTQTLAISGGGDDFVALFAAGPATAAPAPLQPPTAFGGFVNYDAWVADGPDGSSTGAVLDASVSGRLGLLRSAWGLRRGRQGSGSASLGTWWQYDWPARALTLVVGHAGSAPATGRFDFAYTGVRLGTDYALLPGYSGAWRPRLAGAVETTTRLDVVIDGLRRRGTELPYGPFDIAIDAFEPGRQSAELLLADGSGAVRTLRQTWYFSPRLLEPGHAEWAIEAGRPARDAFDLRGARDPAFASASLRRGMTPRLTAHALAHRSRALAIAGGGLVANVADWFVLDAGAFAERATTDVPRERRMGARRIVAAEHRSRRLALAARSERASLERTSAPRVVGQIPLQGLRHALVSLTVADGASAGMQRHLREDFAGRRSRATTFNASWHLGSTALTLLARRDTLDGRQRSRAVALVLSLPLGGHWDASVALTRGSAPQWLAQTRPEAGRPIDVRVAGAGGIERYSALDAEFHHDLGSTIASIRNEPRGSHVQALARGALGFIDGTRFASARIDDSFVLVRTPGHAGVPVLVDHRPAGVTDADGTLVVARSRSHHAVPVAIDSTALPPELAIDRDEVSAIAPRRAGAVVRFDARRPLGLLHVHHADGAPVAAGSAVSFAGGDAALPDTVIGLDGALFVGAPAGGATVTVHDALRRTSCSFVLPPRGEPSSERRHACIAL